MLPRPGDMKATLRKRAVAVLDRGGPGLILLLLCIGVGIADRNFVRPQNVVNFAEQTSVIAIMALGQTFVIIAAGIDLSVGALMALCGVVGALLMRDGFPVAYAVAVAISVGGLAGIASGYLSSRLGIASFITTLGMMLACRGLAKALTGQAPVFDIPSSFFGVDRPAWLGIPTSVYIMFGMAALAHIVLAYSRFGRHTYAVGGGPEAARLAGINIVEHYALVFGLCGAFTGIAGLILTSRSLSAQPTAGRGYELRAIAAAVIGGCSLFGGRGSIWGTMAGAFILAVIKNALNLMNVPDAWQDVVSGGIIVAAAMIDALRRSGRAS
ncbi:MAG: ABC transporter permease [Armatimonadota bacterium]